MKRQIFRTVLAVLLAIVVVRAVVWYASLDRHIPDGWPRVYVASDCPASDFSMRVAERSSMPLATIPVDDGALAERACRHTLELLSEQSWWWGGLDVMPGSLVCARLIRDGSEWMMEHRQDEWPVFVGGDGQVHVGADIEGLRTVGIDVNEDGYSRLLEEYERGD